MRQAPHSHKLRHTCFVMYHLRPDVFNTRTPQGVTIVDLPVNKTSTLEVDYTRRHTVADSLHKAFSEARGWLFHGYLGVCWCLSRLFRRYFDVFRGYLDVILMFAAGYPWSSLCNTDLLFISLTNILYLTFSVLFTRKVLVILGQCFLVTLLLYWLTCPLRAGQFRLTLLGNVQISDAVGQDIFADIICSRIAEHNNTRTCYFRGLGPKHWQFTILS